ncbi:hypothetical protein GCM10023080_093770 [Streptomyces pseudoechinosporeus]
MFAARAESAAGVAPKHDATAGTVTREGPRLVQGSTDAVAQRQCGLSGRRRWPRREAVAGKCDRAALDCHIPATSHLAGEDAPGTYWRASLTRDRDAVDRLIDQASGLLGRVDDDLPWGNACRRTPGYLEVQRATCYGRLGLGAEAVSLWDQVLDIVPETARRDRGVYLARHATPAAGAGEPEQALEIARTVADIAAETRPPTRGRGPRPHGYGGAP